MQSLIYRSLFVCISRFSHTWRRRTPQHARCTVDHTLVLWHVWEQVSRSPLKGLLSYTKVSFTGLFSYAQISSIGMFQYTPVAFQFFAIVARCNIRTLLTIPPWYCDSHERESVGPFCGSLFTHTCLFIHLPQSRMCIEGDLEKRPTTGADIWKVAVKCEYTLL